MSKERIVAAACVGPKGEIWHLPPPCRHGHVLKVMAEVYPNHMAQPDDQGFWTSENRYVGREEAAQIAIDSNRITKLNWPPNLFSEDLW